MKFNRRVWLTAIVMQCAATGALAIEPEFVDYSCPTSPVHLPAIFPEGTGSLDYSGVLHLEDHTHNYQLTYTPRYDEGNGYFDTIVILGLKYTLNAETQTKTYFLDKEKIRQRTVDIPIIYCRSHRIPFSNAGSDMNLGSMRIEDDSGRKKTSTVTLQHLQADCTNDGCYVDGLAVRYTFPNGDLQNVQFAAGVLNQDVRIMKQQPPKP